jgi:hypothetical protein
MAIKLEISADLRQVIQSLQRFSTEIDKTGGVTESIAQQISSSLSLAASEFGKLDKLKVSNNPLGLITKEVSDSVDKLVISMGEASTGISTFNKIEVRNPLTNLPTQANESVDELKDVFSKLQNNVSTLDFTDQFEQARVRLSDTVDKIANDALGLNNAFGSIKGVQLENLNSAFIDAEKPVEQLKAEIFALRDAIGETTNPIVLQRFGDQLLKLQNQLSQKITPTVSFSTAQINTPFVQPKINTADLKWLQIVVESDVQSIQKLNSEIINVGIALDKAVAAKSPLVGSLKKEFDSLVTTVTQTEASAFNTAFVDSASKSITQLENEITVLKNKIDKDLTDPAQIDRFANRITSLQDQLSKLRFGGINLDTSKLTALQSAFVNTIKPVEQLELEIEALNQALKSGANPAQLQAFNAQLKKLQTQLDNTKISGFEGALGKINSSASRAADGLKKVPNASNQAGQALINLGRVAQDAPFGIIGIANNINPLLESFQRLQKESGSTGATIRSLGKELLGGGGLGLAVSVVSSLLVVFGDKLFKSGKEAVAAKEKVDAYGDGIKQAFQDIAQETSKVEILVTALKREKLSRDERKGAIEELQRIAPAYFGTLDKEKFTIDQLIVSYGNYARSLRTAAEAKGLEKQLDAIIERRFEIDKILNPPQFTFDDKGNRIQNFLLDNVATQRVRKQLQSEYNGLLRAEEVLAQRIAQLKPPDLIKPSIEKPKSGKEDNFSFLFDFLPFNPAGNLKDEQRSKLFDSIQKFQKEFRGILKGINFTGSEDQVIQQALKFDVKLKAGKVEFDTKALSDSIHNSLRPEDLLPKGTIDEVAKGATDLFIKTFQLQSENIKDAKLFGDLTLLPTIDKAIEDAKLDLKRVGLELPKTFEGKDPFGNPVELTFDQLFDYHKISPNDAIEAIRKAVAQIKDTAQQMDEEITNAFTSFKTEALTGFGESIGQAIASGGNFFQTAARQFAGAFGNFVEQIGKLLIKYGIIKSGIEKAISSFAVPGVTLIALGVTAVALSALIKSSFGNLKTTRI